MVVVLAAMNLRGVRESGAFFAIPTYGFMLGVIGMAVYGAIRAAQGTLPDVESADLVITRRPATAATSRQAAMIFLLARAFSSGCAALTGVEAISNGVPAFRKPKSKNAATTLFLLGAIAVTMMLSIIILARNMGLRMVDPHDLDRLTNADGSPLPAGYDQHTVIAQIARAVFSDFPPGFYFVVATTGIILILAANTAFNGFPVLGSILAQDGFAPRQLGSRGDRLAYSNGILILAGFAIVLIIAFDAEPTRLIQLYIVGVFVSFNLSQLGMIRHWTRHLKTEDDPAARRKMFRSRVINSFGLAMTASVFVVVLLTKFLAGAWIAILAMIVFFAILRSIRAHYDRVSEELVIGDSDPMMPTRVHAIVLVSKLHKPTMRALAYAKATRPNILEAVFVDTDGVERQQAPRRVGRAADRRTPEDAVLAVPRGDPADRRVRHRDPRGQPARRRGRLHPGVRRRPLVGAGAAQPDRPAAQGPAAVHPGVMVTSVPYQLRGAEVAKERDEWDFQRARPGDVRRGRTRSGR